MDKSIGVVEFRSIAAGISAVDIIVKASQVKILDARTICPGKYYIIFAGMVSAVKNSMDVIESESGAFIIDSVAIPNVYPQIFASLNAASDITSLKSIGIIETLSAPSIIWAANAAIKATDIDIVEIRIARALGGKNICVINGQLSDVKESVNAAIVYAQERDFLVDWQVIAAPHQDLYRAVL